MRQKNYSSLAAKSSFQRLGERVRLARKARGYTLTDLESRCGVHRTTLSRLEAGDTGLTFTVFLCVLEALGCLSDVEAILSSPTTLDSSHAAVPRLDADF